MNYSSKDVCVSLKEVPGEVSLVISFCGCPMQCKGCHSSYLQDPNYGEKFSKQILLEFLKHYGSFITCVTFFGGEWQYDELIEYSYTCQKQGYKVALYTGRKSVTDELMAKLDYIKTGGYVKSLGGLENWQTNQRLVNLRTGEDITYKFWRREI